MRMKLLIVILTLLVVASTAGDHMTSQALVKSSPNVLIAWSPHDAVQRFASSSYSSMFFDQLTSRSYNATPNKVWQTSTKKEKQLKINNDRIRILSGIKPRFGGRFDLLEPNGWDVFLDVEWCDCGKRRVEMLQGRTSYVQERWEGGECAIGDVRGGRRRRCRYQFGGSGAVDASGATTSPEVTVYASEGDSVTLECFPSRDRIHDHVTFLSDDGARKSRTLRRGEIMTIHYAALENDSTVYQCAGEDADNDVISKVTVRVEARKGLAENLAIVFAFFFSISIFVHLLKIIKEHMAAMISKFYFSSDITPAEATRKSAQD